MGDGGCGQFVTLVSAAPLSSGTFCEVYPNFSSMSPPHGLQLFMNCPSVSSSMVTASFRRLLRCGVLRGLQVISAAPRTSAGCRGIACLIIVLSTMAAEVFLLQCLKQNFHWPWGLLCYCCAAVFPLLKCVLLETQSVTVTDGLGLGHRWFCFGAGCAGSCT